MDVQPGIVQAGAVVDLLVELPQLRPGPRPVGLQADGVEVLSTRLVDAVGAETRWAARVRIASEPGPLPVVLRAVYADGRSVEVDTTLVVLGNEEEPGFAWGTAALAVLSAVCLGAAVLLLARRRG